MKGEWNKRNGLCGAKLGTMDSVKAEDAISQEIYCGGYSGEDPPLPIPNREVKLTSADGTAPPGGRVGSCRSSGLRLTKVNRSLFLCPTDTKTEEPAATLPILRVAYPPENPLGRASPSGQRQLRLYVTHPLNPLPREGDLLSTFGLKTEEYSV